MRKSIRISDKEYTIDCPEDELQYLHEAARMLEKTLREVREQNRSANRSDVAVVAGLNMALEAIRESAESEQAITALHNWLEQLNGEVDQSLEDISPHTRNREH